MSWSSSPSSDVRSGRVRISSTIYVSAIAFPGHNNTDSGGQKNNSWQWMKVSNLIVMTWTNTTAAIFRRKQSLLWKAWNRGQPLQRLGQALRDRNRRCHGHHGRHHHRHHRHDDYGRGDGTGQRGHKMWTLRPEYPTMTKHHVFIAPHSCDIRSNMGPTSHDIIISSCYQNWSKHQMKKACGPQYIFQ